jgi:hypothetical protein
MIGAPRLWPTESGTVPKHEFERKRSLNANNPLPPTASSKSRLLRKGRSIRELIPLGVRIIEGKRPRSKRVKFPLIASDGPKVELTNEP